MQAVEAIEFMAQGSGIIGLTQWLQTPAGRYLLGWEQARLDSAVADIFGYHALQLGLPELQALRSNRMPHRWVATESAQSPAPVAARADDGTPSTPADPFADTDPRPVPVADVALRCDFDALPFDAQSLDLVVLPHALELARDPHQALREVERVLVPEGRVVIVGFNPASLWGLRQRVAHLRRVAPGAPRRGFLPDSGEFIGYRRLRDWLRLLSFEVEAGRFGCYRPPVASSRWLARYEWTESVGERWWPVFGAVYFVVAVKRVRGMRLVGLARERRTLARAAPTVVASRHDGGAR